MRYEIDVSRDGGETYKTEDHAPSIDTAKSKASALRKGPYGGFKLGLRFRIYTENGEQLVRESVPTDSWRMRWTDGNMKPRREQDIATPAPAEPMGMTL